MSRWFVRLCAALIILRSFTNFAKVSHGDEAVLVFFGQILRGSDTTVLAVVVGLFMLASWAKPPDARCVQGASKATMPPLAPQKGT